MKEKNCLIFGGSGQIGRNLIRSLQKITIGNSSNKKYSSIKLNDQNTSKSGLD